MLARVISGCDPRRTSVDLDQQLARPTERDIGLERYERFTMLHKWRFFETASIAVVASCIGLVGLSLAQNASTPTGGSLILPAPEPAFGGVIGRKASESKPDYPPAITAPKGAPNVLLIMTDDTGFG